MKIFKNDEFQVLTRNPEGELWELVVMKEKGDLNGAVQTWRDVVNKRPAWSHVVETAKGEQFLRNEPCDIVGPDGPKEVWIPS